MSAYTGVNAPPELYTGIVRDNSNLISEGIKM